MFLFPWCSVRSDKAIEVEKQGLEESVLRARSVCEDVRGSASKRKALADNSR